MSSRTCFVGGRGLLVVLCGSLGCYRTLPVVNPDPSPLAHDRRPTGGADPRTQAEIDEELMARWNLVAGDQPPSSYDFHWSKRDQFPHPTYQGGTAEGYGGFSMVLHDFLQDDDNFDFLEEHHLFRTHLVYVFESGQNGLDTTFEELAVYLSSGTYGDVPDTVRADLASFADQIRRLP